MNQYRCETCDKDCVYANQTPTDELFYCQKFEYDWVRKFTSVKGCTSHSNFQSEREEVLSLLEQICLMLKEVHTGEDDVDHWNLLGEVEGKIIEFRQNDKNEKENYGRDEAANYDP